MFIFALYFTSDVFGGGVRGEVTLVYWVTRGVTHFFLMLIILYTKISLALSLFFLTDEEITMFMMLYMPNK